ncbi:MAG: T9SS type A sorting domain-containing protein, partial [Bacteroidales bacterium]|nr:T9SS type A sorting domain-containing protein [Bacteroidales bacterium]
INGEKDTDVWLVKSTDGGETWTVPVRVNDDPPGKQQFLTWLTVDQSNGYLYFVFYDRRNYNNNQTDVFLAVSSDGGQTFNNFVISESPFNPYSGVFFGDYNNISVVNNMVRPIWTRNESGNLSIYTAIIDMSTGIPEKDMSPTAPEQNYPNPFRESTVFSFKITQPGNVKLSVIDPLGKEIIVLKEEYMVRGKYTFSFDTSNYHLSPGVYYFNLLSSNKSFKRKMVIANN